MAKMTKAQARKRLAEAGTKIMKVMIDYPEALSLTKMDSIIKTLSNSTKKLK